jgi:hypothetical protein
MCSNCELFLNKEWYGKKLQFCPVCGSVLIPKIGDSPKIIDIINKFTQISKLDIHLATVSPISRDSATVRVIENQERLMDYVMYKHRVAHCLYKIDGELYDSNMAGDILSKHIYDFSAVIIENI